MNHVVDFNDNVRSLPYFKSLGISSTDMIEINNKYLRLCQDSEKREIYAGQQHYYQACLKSLKEMFTTYYIDYLTQNDSLNPDQFGFIQFHSTDLALLQLFDRVSNALADHKNVKGIFIDLSKAFDTLDHRTLLYKLKHYGVRGKALEWFENYLTSRRQKYFIRFSYL